MPPIATERSVLRVKVPIVAFCAKRLVLDAVVAKKLVDVALANVVAPVKELTPEKVLLLARSVDDAAVIVKVPPAVIGVALMVARDPVRRLAPIDVVATTEPLALTERSELERLEIAKADEVALANVVAPVKVLTPEKVLLFERSVVDAPVRLDCEM